MSSSPLTDAEYGTPEEIEQRKKKSDQMEEKLKALYHEKHVIENRQHWLYTFAGQAMQGLLGTNEGLKYNYEVRAEWAVRQARALLAELEKETP